MNMKNLFFAMSIFFLTSCSGDPITSVVVQHDLPVVVPIAQPLVMNPVKFVVTNQNSVLYFSLDTENYTNLQLNFTEIQRYIGEQKVIINMLNKINSDRAAQGVVKEDK